MQAPLELVDVRKSFGRVAALRCAALVAAGCLLLERRDVGA